MSTSLPTLRILLLNTMISLTSCAWVSSEQLDEKIDHDGDGFPSQHLGGSDCEDEDPLINPAATEVPGNNVDENCDARIACYADSDGDGDGSENTVLSDDLSCTGPGESDNNEDCDDTDSSRGPGRLEICGDGKDNDCDQGTVACSYLIDEAADEVIEGDDLHFGTAMISERATDGGEAYLIIGAPGADSERGSVLRLGGFGTSEVGARPLHAGLNTGDRFGSAVALHDLTEDGLTDLIVSAPGDDYVAVVSGPFTENPVSTTVLEVPGPQALHTGTVGTAPILGINTTGGMLLYWGFIEINNIINTFDAGVGPDMVFADRDGLLDDELCLQATYNSVTRLGCYTTYSSFNGNPIGSVDNPRPIDTVLAQYTPAEAIDAGDIDGDSQEDLIFTMEGQGQTLIALGIGWAEGWGFGRVVTIAPSAPTVSGRIFVGVVGDLNGDEAQDFAITLQDPPDYQVFVFFGDSDFPAQLSLEEDANLILNATSGGDFGRVLIKAGDLDGDGQDDLVLSDRLAGNGTVYFLSGASIAVPAPD